MGNDRELMALVYSYCRPHHFVFLWRREVVVGLEGFQGELATFSIGDFKVVERLGLGLVSC